MEWNGNEFASKTFVCLDSSYTILMFSVTDCFHVPFLVTLHYPTPSTQFQNCIYIFIVLEVLNATMSAVYMVVLFSKDPLDLDTAHRLPAS